MKSLVTCVFLSTLALGQSLGPTPEGVVCPLSESQTNKSIDAFSKIASTIAQENRCLGCHGRVNPYIDGTGPDPNDPELPPSEFEHGPGKVDKKADCNECHSNMARKTRDGSQSHWMTAPPFLSFVGKDAPTLCKQIKGALHLAKDFIGHLTDDNGNNNFAGTAFNGDRGLDRSMFPESEVPTEKPHITQAAFLKLAHNWIDAMGGEFQGDKACGCEPSHYLLRMSAQTTVAVEDVRYEAAMNPVDIPIEFNDDGTFTGTGTADFQGAGVGGDCTMSATANVTFSVSGKAVETLNEQSMHIKLKTASPMDTSGTARCPERSGSVQKALTSQETWPFDGQGKVGEVLQTPMPSPGPGITTTNRLEIVKKD